MPRSHKSSRARSWPGGRRGPKGRGSFKTTLLWLGLVLVLLAALVVGGKLAIDHTMTEKIDAQFCYARADRQDVAVFVDFSLTNRISASQRRDLVNTLMQTWGGLPPNARISVFTTANQTTSSISTPVFELCRPPATVVEQNRITSPTKLSAMLAREAGDARKRFEAFVDDLVAGSTESDTLAASSPILEQLQGISRYYAGRNLARLVVYSDGVNNSPNGRFCAEQNALPPFEAFAQRPGYKFIAPDSFAGATIDVLLVEIGVLPSSSLPHCSNAELRAFWVDYFEANGAGSVRLTPLGYGAGQ